MATVESLGGFTDDDDLKAASRRQLLQQRPATYMVIGDKDDDGVGQQGLLFEGEWPAAAGRAKPDANWCEDDQAAQRQPYQQQYQPHQQPQQPPAQQQHAHYNTEQVHALPSSATAARPIPAPPLCHHPNAGLRSLGPSPGSSGSGHAQPGLDQPPLRMLPQNSAFHSAPAALLANSPGSAAAAEAGMLDGVESMQGMRGFKLRERRGGLSASFTRLQGQLATDAAALRVVSTRVSDG